MHDSFVRWYLLKKLGDGYVGTRYYFYNFLWVCNYFKTKGFLKTQDPGSEYQVCTLVLAAISSVTLFITVTFERSHCALFLYIFFRVCPLLHIHKKPWQKKKSLSDSMKKWLNSYPEAYFLSSPSLSFSICPGAMIRVYTFTYKQCSVWPNLVPYSPGRSQGRVVGSESPGEKLRNEGSLV